MKGGHPHLHGRSPMYLFTPISTRLAAGVIAAAVATVAGLGA